MKTKKSILSLALAFCLTLISTTFKAQSTTFPLYNQLNCDVVVNIEVGNMGNCPPNTTPPIPPLNINTPCNNYVVTIPAGGSHIVSGCGFIHELCITVISIGGTVLIPSCHTNNIAYVSTVTSPPGYNTCCMSPWTNTAGNIHNGNCPSYTVNRILGSWTIQ